MQRVLMCHVLPALRALAVSAGRLLGREFPGCPRTRYPRAVFAGEAHRHAGHSNCVGGGKALICRDVREGQWPNRPRFVSHARSTFFGRACPSKIEPARLGTGRAFAFPLLECWARVQWRTCDHGRRTPRERTGKVRDFFRDLSSPILDFCRALFVFRAYATVAVTRRKLLFVV